MSLDNAPGDMLLETDRLILRVHGAQHFDPYAEMSADPGTFRFSDRGPMTGDEAWTRLLRNVGHWSLLGYGLFAIEEKQSGRFVGEAGFCDFRRQLGERFDPYPEGAWAIADWAQGRGYATEAVLAALGWMEARRDVRRTVCLIHAGNEASIRVARRLGYVSFDECIYKGYPALLFERRSAQRG